MPNATVNCKYISELVQTHEQENQEEISLMVDFIYRCRCRLDVVVCSVTWHEQILQQREGKWAINMLNVPGRQTQQSAQSIRS